MAERKSWFRRRYLAIIVALVALFLAPKAGTNSQNPSVVEYYGSLESRLGYWLVMGNTRHSGFWEKGTIWPFPMGKALRRMEDKLFTSLDLKPGAKVLDAGCGSGFVAMHMASRGLNVEAIDITPHHLEQAQSNIKDRGLDDKINVELGDYHDLSRFPSNSFDGIYTMETFVHADDPVKVLENFYRILKPGGVLVQHEADFNVDFDRLQEILTLSHCQNTLEHGTLHKSHEEVGFEVVKVENYSDEVLPLWRFFGFLGYLPYKALQLLGLQRHFTNAMSGVEIYLHWDEVGYISVKSFKPQG